MVARKLEQRRRAIGAPLLQGGRSASVMPLTYPFVYEMFEKEERTVMTQVDSRTVQCHLCGCLIAVVTDASENIRPERSHITPSVRLSWPELSRQTSGPATKRGKKEGVHNVHTLGFGSSRTGAGLGRIAEVFGGSADIQGLESGSSPTSGTVFPLFRGLWSAECGQMFAGGPLRGLFCWPALRLVGSFVCLGQQCCCLLIHVRDRWKGMTEFDTTERNRKPCWFAR